MLYPHFIQWGQRAVDLNCGYKDLNSPSMYSQRKAVPADSEDSLITGPDVTEGVKQF